MSYNAGGNLRSLTAADLNDDSFLELVIQTNSSVNVLENRGGGIFRTAQGYWVSASMNDLNAWDFNSDSHTDFVVSQEQGFEVWENDGSGHFFSRMLYSTTWSPGKFVLVDLNNDTLVDAVAISDNDIFIWMNPATVTSVEPGQTLIPGSFELSQNYPNPFNASTRIRFSLPKMVHVTVRVYNILGQEVITLLNKQRPPGTYVLQWDGRNHYGNLVASGLYFCSMRAGDWQKTVKMLMMK